VTRNGIGLPLGTGAAHAGASPGHRDGVAGVHLVQAGPPRFVRVGEPDQFGIEGVNAPQAPGVGLLELAEPHRHIATDDDRAPTVADDDHL
jgi:hypothetical protein